MLFFYMSAKRLMAENKKKEVRTKFSLLDSAVFHNLVPK